MEQKRREEQQEAAVDKDGTVPTSYKEEFERSLVNLKANIVGTICLRRPEHRSAASTPDKKPSGDGQRNRSAQIATPRLAGNQRSYATTTCATTAATAMAANAAYYDAGCGRGYHNGRNFDQAFHAGGNNNNGNNECGPQPYKAKNDERRRL